MRRFCGTLWGETGGVTVNSVGKYSIIEVEQLLGVSRTKIRYYMDRGMIHARKDEQSGYYLYSDDDLVRICQILYYREMLGFALEKVEQLIETSDMGAIESITERQLGFLRDERELRNQQMNTLLFNREMIERHKRQRDRVLLVPFEPMYLVPYQYYFMFRHRIYPITYGASEFCFDGREAAFVKRWVAVFEKDAKYVGMNVFDEFRCEGERFEVDECVYHACITTKDAHDPALLKPALDWAAAHRFKVGGRMFVTYFFPFYVKDETYLHMECYLPVV